MIDDELNDESSYYSIVPPNSKRILFVNRDTNPCRSIIYKGLCKLLGLKTQSIAFSCRIAE